MLNVIEKRNQYLAIFLIYLFRQGREPTASTPQKYFENDKNVKFSFYFYFLFSKWRKMGQFSLFPPGTENSFFLASPKLRSTDGQAQKSAISFRKINIRAPFRTLLFTLSNPSS